jgi:uncharacterized membrane protein YqjE
MKALVDRVVALLHGRVELFTTDLEEELTRLIGVLLWSLVAVMTAIIGTTFLAVMTLLFLPVAYRSWAALGIAVIFLAVALFGLVSIKRVAHIKPRPFDASLTALEQDREALRGDR